jgi:predicted nucleic acid-binding protein
MSGDRIVVDTSLIINLFNGVNEVQELITDRDLFVSIISEIEVLSFPNITPEDLGLLKEFLSQCTSLILSPPLRISLFQSGQSLKLSFRMRS